MITAPELSRPIKVLRAFPKGKIPTPPHRRLKSRKRVKISEEDFEETLGDRLGIEQSQRKKIGEGGLAVSSSSRSVPWGGQRS